MNLPHLQPQNVELQIHDWTDKVPGYDDDYSPESIIEDIMKIVEAGDYMHICRLVLIIDADCIFVVPKDVPFDVVIDSADTLLDLVPSASKVYNLLCNVLSKVRSGASKCLIHRPHERVLNNPTDTSRLIVHIQASSPLIPLLCQTRFSPSLTHLISHPPVLLAHLSTSYFTPPPPLSPPEKFWSVFTPISERLYESEKLVFGSEGAGHAGDEIVVEVIVRGGGEGAAGRKRGVEKVLEGWVGEEGRPCELSALESLRSVFTRKAMVEEVCLFTFLFYFDFDIDGAQAAPDPTQNVSFNLHLTAEQERSRAQVPLPYAHEGDCCIQL